MKKIILHYIDGDVIFELGGLTLETQKQILDTIRLEAESITGIDVE